MADASGVAVTIGSLTVRDRAAALARWGVPGREVERGGVLIDQAHPDLREILLQRFVTVPAEDRRALAEVLLAWDTASDPGAAFVAVAPWRHRAPDLCGLCGTSHDHEHARLRCIECGAQGLDEDMAGPDARHVCQERRAG